MIMTHSLRKFALTAHVTASVGWLGAVVAFLALAVAGLTSLDSQRVRAAYLAMELTAWFVIVPLSLASPLTGVIQSLGTTWGLFRHYWVVAKFVITVPATTFLFLHMRPIGHLAHVVAETTLTRGDLAGLRIQLVADAVAAMVVLLVATTLSVYKPWGMTPYGRRKEHDQGGSVGPARGSTTESTPRWVYLCGFIIIVVVLLFVILHLTGGPGH